MSDSLLPNGGPDPDDGWDFEGMLSGVDVWLPDGMRLVAGTLSALRAAPTPAELVGEASARAAFHQVMRANGTGSDWPDRGAVDGHTLILPAQGAGGGSHVVTRPRHSHRRPPRRGHWRPKALAGAAVSAVAVVVVGGVALGGGFSGAGGQPGRSASVVGATTPSGHFGSNGLDGTASEQPAAHPSSSHSNEQQSGDGTDSAAALCRRYLAFFTRHGSPSGWAKESDTIGQLSDLAGGPRHIVSYCVRLQQPWVMTPEGSGADLDGPSLSPPDGQSGHSGNGSGLGGSGSVGNSRNGNNSGSGSQGQQ